MSDLKGKRGTVLKVTTTTDTTPDGAAITIVDPNGTTKVDAQAMSGSGTSWSYIWQSDEADAAGKYIITIRAALGSYIALKQDFFVLLVHA